MSPRRRQNTLTPAMPSQDESGIGPYERLKDAILVGDLFPGQPLTEVMLASRMSVSRTPIREALTRLEQDGLIIRTDRGMMVRERSPEEILDIYEIRILLEAAAARFAAERRSEVDVLTLKRVAAELERLDTDDSDERAKANRKLHRALWRAAHNEPLTDLLQRLDLHLMRYPATTLSQPGRWEATLPEHREIIDSIERRDPEQAAEAATRHFKAARDVRLTLWGEGST